MEQLNGAKLTERLLKLTLGKLGAVACQVTK